jgi:hypothetical protein
MLVWLFFPEYIDCHSKVFKRYFTRRHVFLLNNFLMFHFELFKCIVNNLLQTFNFNFISPSIYLLDLLIRCWDFLLFFLILFLDDAIYHLCFNSFVCFNCRIPNLFGVKDSDSSDADFCFRIFTIFVKPEN